MVGDYFYKHMPTLYYCGKTSVLIKRFTFQKKKKYDPPGKIVKHFHVDLSKSTHPSISWGVRTFDSKFPRPI